jgi:virginiamycin B lyase
MKLLRPLISHIKDLKDRGQRSGPKSRRARPALEGLEVRCVPSTLTELPSLPTLNSHPTSITTASDGSIWFTERYAGKLGRLSPQGTLTEYPIPFGNAEDITASPDGYVWFTLGGFIGRVSAAGGPIAEFALPGYDELAAGITTRSDGSVWFASNLWRAPGYSRIGEISSTGTITELAAVETNTFITGLVGGPDGNLWASQKCDCYMGDNGVAKVSTAGSGSFTVYPIPGDYLTAAYSPEGITVGPDNNLWFTEFDNEAFGNISHGRIGRITTSGVHTEFALPEGSQATGPIVAGPDGAVWFTEGR